MMPRLLLIAALALLTACAGHDNPDRTAPRPRALPRIDVPRAIYAAADSLPVTLMLNASLPEPCIDRRPDGSVWLDISYPYIGGVLSLTVTPPLGRQAYDEAVRIRTERMALNNGGNHPETLGHTNPGGYATRIEIVRQGSPNPIQFISGPTDRARPRRLVSGTLTLRSAPNDPDSLRPAIDAVVADIMTMAEALSTNQ